MAKKNSKAKTKGGARKKRKPTRKKDPLAPEVGRRIEEAWQRQGFDTFTAFAEAVQIDQKLLRSYISGGTMPGPRPLMSIARACNVSIDWLLMGTERTPAALLEWLDSPVGKAATPDERRLLRALPLAGYEPSPAFYDLALHAIRLGLSPDETVLAARSTGNAKGDL